MPAAVSRPTGHATARRSGRCRWSRRVVPHSVDRAPRTRAPPARRSPTDSAGLAAVRGQRGEGAQQLARRRSRPGCQALDQLGPALARPDVRQQVLDVHRRADHVDDRCLERAGPAVERRQRRQPEPDPGVVPRQALPVAHSIVRAPGLQQLRLVQVPEPARRARPSPSARGFR